MVMHANINTYYTSVIFKLSAVVETHAVCHKLNKHDLWGAQLVSSGTNYQSITKTAHPLEELIYYVLYYIMLKVILIMLKETSTYTSYLTLIRHPKVQYID